ncbi:M23 family metallopeptidase [Dietzia sp. ANT_WB102]|uniref:M23 family metallopeptidase n=1 Tax=Dietzia sp. ANT_WB102 TaxID=2597345 RepID=UPI0011ED9414|nr:M23 family metallopeptidase [Dietzia sp. ANT_WB102]
MPAPPQALRGRAAVLAIAAGAAVSAASAGSALSDTGTHSADAGDIALLANGEPAPATSTPGAPTTSAPATPSAPEPVVVVPVSAAGPSSDDISSTMLYAGTEINAQREIAEEQARRPKVAMPAIGAFTSPYAMRWGSFHAGIDIANVPGSDIYAATDGTVIDSGPAQGFGNWIRIMADDGTMTVYGHMQSLDVAVGERVHAGQKIAGMGSLGFSTGSHLHFEVLVNGGKDHVDPLTWLLERGLDPMAGSVEGSSSSGS